MSDSMQDSSVHTYERHSYETPQFLAADKTLKSAITAAKYATTVLHTAKRRLILEFHPAYFVTIMGCGILSVILYKFPYPAYWLQVCGCIMWGFSVFFFIVTLVSFIASMVVVPSNFLKFHRDPAVSVYLGCLSMGYTTTFVNFLHAITPKSFIIGVYVFWWISLALSLYCAIVIFYFGIIAKYHKKHNSLSNDMLNATLLLPIVTLTVTASAGALICPDLPSTNLQVVTLVICYLIWAAAVGLAFVIIGIYYWKLCVHKVPSTALVFSSFLPVGVMGQGAFGILLIGKDIFGMVMEHHELLLLSPYMSYVTNSPVQVSESVNSVTAGFVVGTCFIYFTALMSLFLNAFGLFSTVIAIMTCLSKIYPFTKHHDPQLTYFTKEHPSFLRRRMHGLMRFSKAFWAMTFPLGTMSLANSEMADLHNGMHALRVVGAIYGTALILIDIGCIIGTFYCAIQDVLADIQTLHHDNDSMNNTVVDV